MNKSELKPGYYMYGNKGACWSDKIHIAKNNSSTTLCGQPMLASNWARILKKETIGCANCMTTYKQ